MVCHCEAKTILSKVPSNLTQLISFLACPESKKFDAFAKLDNLLDNMRFIYRETSFSEGLARQAPDPLAMMQAGPEAAARMIQTAEGLTAEMFDMTESGAPLHEDLTKVCGETAVAMSRALMQQDTMAMMQAAITGQRAWLAIWTGPKFAEAMMPN